jgi:hypothetical protein
MKYAFRYIFKFWRIAYAAETQPLIVVWEKLDEGCEEEQHWTHLGFGLYWRTR